MLADVYQYAYEYLIDSRCLLPQMVCIWLAESAPAAPAGKEGTSKPAAAATNGSKAGGKKEGDGGKAKSGAKPKPEIGKDAAGSFVSWQLVGKKKMQIYGLIYLFYLT
jgi:hypothetical protein